MRQSKRLTEKKEKEKKENEARVKAEKERVKKEAEEKLKKESLNKRISSPKVTKKERVAGGPKAHDEVKIKIEAESPGSSNRGSCSPSPAFKTRINRALTNRLYLIDQEPTHYDEELGPSRTFVVQGDSGHCYYTTISSRPKCSCPDWKTRKGRCKHMFFLFIRVLQVPKDDGFLFGEDLDEEVIGTLFEGLDNRQQVGDNFRASADVIDSYKHAKDSRTSRKRFNFYAGHGHGGDIDEDGSPGSPVRKTTITQTKIEVPPLPMDCDETCAICFEPLLGEELSHCRYTCGRSIHTQCINIWLKNKKTCPLCRQSWV